MLFSNVKALINPLYNTCTTANTTANINAKEADIWFRSLLRANQIMESEYWTYINQVVTNITPNEC